MAKLFGQPDQYTLDPYYILYDHHSISATRKAALCDISQKR